MKELCERHTNTPLPAPDRGGGELVQTFKYDSEVWNAVLLFIPYFFYIKNSFLISRIRFFYIKNYFLIYIK